MSKKIEIGTLVEIAADHKSTDPAARPFIGLHGDVIEAERSGMETTYPAFVDRQIEQISEQTGVDLKDLTRDPL